MPKVKYFFKDTLFLLAKKTLELSGNKYVQPFPKTMEESLKSHYRVVLLKEPFLMPKIFQLV